MFPPSAEGNRIEVAPVVIAWGVGRFLMVAGEVVVLNAEFT